MQLPKTIERSKLIVHDIHIRQNTSSNPTEWSVLGVPILEEENELLGRTVNLTMHWLLLQPRKKSIESHHQEKS